MEDELINKIKANFGEYCLLNPLDFEMDEISKDVILVFFIFKELLKKYTNQKYQKEELDLKLFKEEKIFKITFTKKVNKKRILINGIFIKEKNEFSIDFLKDYNEKEEKAPNSIKIKLFEKENKLNIHLKNTSEKILEKIILKNFIEKKKSFTLQSKKIIEIPQRNNQQTNPQFYNQPITPSRPQFTNPEIGRNDLLPPGLNRGNSDPFGNPNYGMRIGPNHPVFRSGPGGRGRQGNPDIDYPEENPNPFI